MWLEEVIQRFYKKINNLFLLGICKKANQSQFSLFQSTFSSICRSETDIVTEFTLLLFKIKFSFIIFYIGHKFSNMQPYLIHSEKIRNVLSIFLVLAQLHNIQSFHTFIHNYNT